MRTLKLTLLTALLCTSAFANHYADLYVIPVASHTPGSGGTTWMTDLSIHNFQSTSLDVQIIVVEGGVGSDNVAALATPTVNGMVTVPAGGSVMLRDVLNGHRGMSSTIGALIVGADRPFALSSRSYNSSPSGGTFGQNVQPAANFLDNTVSPVNLATAVAYLPGLVQNGEYRTNLGMLAANASGSGGPMAILVTIRGTDGRILGERSFSVAAGEIVQMQFGARSMVAGNFDVASAEFRITSGSGSIAPYASVVDNRTGDSTYVSGVFPQNSSSATSVFRRLLAGVVAQ